MGPTWTSIHCCFRKVYSKYWDTLFFTTAQISGFCENSLAFMLSKDVRLLQDKTKFYNLHFTQIKSQFYGYESFPHFQYSSDLRISSVSMKSFLKEKLFHQWYLSDWWGRIMAFGPIYGFLQTRSPQLLAAIGKMKDSQNFLPSRGIRSVQILSLFMGCWNL